MVLGTFVDLWQNVNPFPPLAIRNESLLVKVLKCFSFYTNGKTILNTNTGKNHITCMAGIRSITMCWIIYGHLYQRILEIDPIIQNRKPIYDVMVSLT